MKTILLSLAVGIFSAGLARADVSDSGNLNIGRQAVVTGTMAVQGNAFSVGGSTFVVIGSSVGVGTTNPGYNLDVQGTGYINAAGALCIAGVCNTTWPNTSPWTTAGSMVLLVTPGNNVVAQSSLTVQGNAFSVGGSSFTVAGGSATVAYQLTAGSLNLTGAYGNVVSRASVTAAGLFGDGSNIANLSGANVAANSITNSQLASGSFGNITGVGTLGSLTVSGAANFAGSGIWNASGNVGIGTSNPTAKLALSSGTLLINGAPAHLQLQDGTQANGRVLTSDASGVGTWQAASSGPSPIFVASGTFADASFTTTVSGICLSGSSITVNCNNANCRFIAEYYGSEGENSNNALGCIIEVDGLSVAARNTNAWTYLGPGAAWTFYSPVIGFSSTNSTRAGNPHTICLSCNVAGGTGSMTNNYWFIQEVPE